MTSAREVVARYAAQVRGESGRAHEAWLAARTDLARERIDDACVWLALGVAGPHLDGAPTPTVAAELILGRRPRELAPCLTDREANAWATQTDHATPSAWLWAQVVTRHALPGASRRPNWPAVIRWADQALSDPARATAVRSALARLDELEPADLRASVSETFARAVARAVLEAWTGPDQLCDLPAWADRLPPGVRVLTHATDLVIEGHDLGHCVAQYCARVHRGECVILAVAVGSDRSTAEIVGRQARQHKAARNREPSAACAALLTAALAVIG